MSAGTLFDMWFKLATVMANKMDPDTYLYRTVSERSMRQVPVPCHQPAQGGAPACPVWR